MTEPIDVVITWVDGDDPTHAARRALYQGSAHSSAGQDATRFADRDELYFCLLSILRHAPFVRLIHVVTDNQTPAAIARLAAQNIPGHQKIRLVDHREIFRGHDTVLPVFNSISIESMLARIEGLSEQFVMFNDDMMLTAKVQPQDWFQEGQVVLRGVWFGLGLTVLGWLRGHARHLPGLRAPAARFSNKEASRRAAVLAGLKGRTFVLAHAPYPALKSHCLHLMQSLPGYFDNASHRFRSADQFNVIALFSQAEIARHQPVVLGEDDVVYMRADRDRLDRVLQKIARVQAAGVKFLCIQSLDQASPPTAAAIADWLRNSYLADQAPTP